MWIDPASILIDPAWGSRHVPGVAAVRNDLITHLRPMERKIYHLSTCSTCQRILKEIPKLKTFTLQDIKTEPITAAQLDAMKKLAGSYEALFSRRSMKYRPMGLHEMELKEKDYRKYILQEYTFLKRPVIIIGDAIFIGNTKAAVEGAVAAAK